MFNTNNQIFNQTGGRPSEDSGGSAEAARRPHEDGGRAKAEEERGTGENTRQKELSRQSFLRVQTLTFSLKRIFSF